MESAERRMAVPLLGAAFEMAVEQVHESAELAETIEQPRQRCSVRRFQLDEKGIATETCHDNLHDVSQHLVLVVALGLEPHVQ